MTRGFFYFRLTNNGNLVGEFFNDADTSIRTESADTINNENRFDNSYLSTWREGNTSEIVNLNIRISDSNRRVFDLVWFRNNEDIAIFRGQAIEIEENLLSGYYFAS
ncbi:hypothetical protein QE422_001584 [Chryseobacterium sp. SORGH_AS 447]|uniref:hypothetical protein n=1 Tax=Chryseobacterium sp. SORGH_AS_0447 TaxID=3041769 RepID=UPI0027827B49|nr:hypothetical protein [Chryseobacterium sp. SORGH_AS_0447]MDQ1161216.1 hypothetical protein [Chryseobacterium sp. SORGH_AS_0447]